MDVCIDPKTGVKTLFTAAAVLPGGVIIHRDFTWAFMDTSTLTHANPNSFEYTKSLEVEIAQLRAILSE